MTSMANARSRGNIPLTDVDKHCDRERGPAPWARRRGIERNRARNGEERGRVPDVLFFPGVVAVSSVTEARRRCWSLFLVGRWKSVTMDMRGEETSLFSRVRSRYRVTRVKYATTEDEKDDEEEGGAPQKLVGV